MSALAPLVVKRGVALGGLGEGQRALALGFVWAGLARSVLSEPGVNAALKAQLAGAARCLATDHVELRRWLCDAGWLRRDAWGREYRRAAPPELPAALQSLGVALEKAFDGGATAAWAEGQRVAREAERSARRRAHEQTGLVAGQPAP
ncbi:MAG: DUF2087 domain-containing protein [Rubrivivax sp.]